LWNRPGWRPGAGGGDTDVGCEKTRNDRRSGLLLRVGAKSRTPAAAGGRRRGANSIQLGPPLAFPIFLQTTPKRRMLLVERCIDDELLDRLLPSTVVLSFVQQTRGRESADTERLEKLSRRRFSHQSAEAANSHAVRRLWHRFVMEIREPPSATLTSASRSNRVAISCGRLDLGGFGAWPCGRGNRLFDDGRSSQGRRI